MADYQDETLSFYLTENASWCFNYDSCIFKFPTCDKIHNRYRYNDVSAAWVLIASIIVFFMKAGFLLVELSFAQNPREKRYVVVLKHLDAFASAFGFFLIGFDYISGYSSPQNIPRRFFQITDPVLWFFKFTFASNAATIVGGCLVTNTYKLRLPAAFISAFVISGIVHPVIARIIWSDNDISLSPYRFCNISSNTSEYTCHEQLSLSQRLYILDFAGGGAVHMLGGVAGLLLCLFAKFQKYRDNNCCTENVLVEVNEREPIQEAREIRQSHTFWQWMYPVDGGSESTSEAALGVLILWFCWFAFNCGSTESVQSQPYLPMPFHAVPSIIAINMIMACATGGVLAVIIASWAQISSASESMNANEIANGVLSALVAITAGCPFVEYWAACLIGGIAVIIYHLGCYLEYKFNIEDTARVVPVHGACGLWSLIAIGLFVVSHEANCTLHATFEGLCYCSIRLPPLNNGERLLAQVIGALLMIGVTSVILLVTYGILFIIPISSSLSGDNHCARKYNSIISWILKKIFRRDNVKFKGNLLFTGPEEIPQATHDIMNDMAHAGSDLNFNNAHTNYGATNLTRRETLGTVEAHSDSAPLISLSSGTQTTKNDNTLTKYEIEFEEQENL